MYLMQTPLELTAAGRSWLVAEPFGTSVEAEEDTFLFRAKVQSFGIL